MIGYPDGCPDGSPSPKIQMDCSMLVTKKTDASAKHNETPQQNAQEYIIASIDPIQKDHRQ
jgi:hypothetical protein